MFKQLSQAEHYASLLKTLVVEGGKLARNMKNSASVEEKADKSLVTAADLAVTELIKERLSSILKQENHILIDEESASQLPSVEEATNFDYQWVLDPIDGTAPYSAGLPFYAVSLGLMQKGKPWLGAAYMPDLDELFWTDGKGNVLHQTAVSGAGRTVKLPKAKTRSMFNDTPYLNELHERYADGLVPVGYKLTTGSFVCGVLHMIKTNALGFTSRAYIWDNAAMLAMANTLDYKAEYVHSGEVIEALNSDTLGDTWLNNEAILIAPKENIEFLRNKVLNEKH